MRIVLENKGIKTDTYYIPPFTLYEGEIIVLYLYNGKHLYDAEIFLRDIFCGKIKHGNVTLHRKMTFVEYFKRSCFRDTFFPLTTVKRYLKRNANSKSPLYKRIFEDKWKWITPETRLEKIPGTPKKLLTLYAALSKTKDIVFDLGALDDEGYEYSFKAIEEIIKQDGGSAILLHCFDNMEEYASKIIALEWNAGHPPEGNEFHFNF
ncbi:hypothetical protein [Flavobacterium johnsoniae]|uniref:Uncharacterized protein n=1 Tax=Flavobacterium johnsoniae TaxID=986 RepID=A0A1M5NP69_FLAJO|nr:hypothetical protein [Flavobacterium johnsoniae]SHG91346.1 hypothetical protein SAMN05444388_10581 [Flavobacterium johnsoniae]